MKAGNFLCVSALFAGAFTTTADIIARWTFETSQPLATDSASVGPISSELGSGMAYGVHASANTDWSNPVGNGSMESWSANNWAVGDYFEFQVSTLGYADLTVSWDQTRSSSGVSVFDLSYSLDGSVFTVFTDDYTVAATSWSSGSVSAGSQYSALLAAVDVLEQQPSVYFRLVAQAAPGDPAGAVRVDNFSVEGVAVPEAETSAALLTAGLGLAGWHLRRRMARRA